jgi:hypothetical protein
VQLVSAALAVLTSTALAFGHLGCAASGDSQSPKASQAQSPQASGVQSPQASQPPPRESAALGDRDDSQAFTADELEQLVGPVALYPDGLLPVVLAASTFPLEVVQAARFLDRHARDESLTPDERWDESVLALINYPEVVELMNDDLNWTWQLGEAVAYQQEDVMDAVQAFRQRVKTAGNLVPNEQMVVEQKEIEGTQVIVIESASPEVVFVPVYRPSQVVIVHAHPCCWWWGPPHPWSWHRSAVFWVGPSVVFRASWGHRGHSSIRVNRNVNVNINNPGRGTRPGAGDRWNADRSPGSRAGSRPGRSNRNEVGTRPSRGGAGDRVGNRANPGGNARAGNRATAGGNAQAANRPTAGGNARAGNRATAGGNARAGNRAAPGGRGDSSSQSSFGNMSNASSARSQSARGASSRGGARGGGRGGGRR